MDDFAHIPDSWKTARREFRLKEDTSGQAIKTFCRWVFWSITGSAILIFGIMCLYALTAVQGVPPPPDNQFSAMRRNAEQQIRKNAKDPDSIRFEEWGGWRTERTESGAVQSLHGTVLVRGKNSFGAVVPEVYEVSANVDGQVTSIARVNQ